MVEGAFTASTKGSMIYSHGERSRAGRDSHLMRKPIQLWNTSNQLSQRAIHLSRYSCSFESGFLLRYAKRLELLISEKKDFWLDIVLALDGLSMTDLDH